MYPQWSHGLESSQNWELSTSPIIWFKVLLQTNLYFYNKGWQLLSCQERVMMVRVRYANHNLNNIKQMSMLKVNCDFDGGDCCPNGTSSNIWDTFCNSCKCLEWYLLVEKFEEQFCQTLWEFLWLGSEIHWEQLVSGELSKTVAHLSSCSAEQLLSRAVAQ